MIWHHLTIDTININNVVAVAADLLHGSRYANVRYAPRIAPLRPSALAGSGEYEDVEEEILIDVLGNTPAEAASNLQYLLAIISGAREWADGQNVPAVQIRALPACPVAGALPTAAILLGPSPGVAPGSVQIGPDVSTPGRYSIRDVSLSVVRRGLWLGARATAASSYATIGNIHSVTGLTESTVSCPTIAAIQGETKNDDVWGDCVIAVADGATRIAAIAAGGGSLTGSGYSTTAGTAVSFGANLMRYSTAVNGVASLSAFAGTTLGASTQLIGALATARNNDSASVWQIRLLVRDFGNVGSIDPAYTGPVVISGASTAPQVIVFPPAALRSIANDAQTIDVAIEVTRLSGSGTTTIDVDEIVLIALDTPGATIVSAAPQNAGALADEVLVFPGERPDTLSDAIVQTRGRNAGVLADRQSGAQGFGFWDYRGDPVIGSSGTTVLGVCVAVSGSDWRPPDSGSAPVRTRLQISRYASGLVPQ